MTDPIALRAKQNRRFGFTDLIVLVGVAGLILGITHFSEEVTGTLRPTIEIDLSPLALPAYTFNSLSRGLTAYVFSMLFTLIYGYWAAKDQAAERVLIPLLDILQSIPVLGFMPGLVIGLIALFPKSNVGLELAAIIMIFTGQVWNMTFSFYHSLRSIPADQIEASIVYRYSKWQRFKWVELPSSTMGLVWNSMMSMAGGWFFLMINEAFQLGDKDYRLPGIGSYMSVAVQNGDVPAMLWAIFAMIAMIVLLDQLVWRPTIVWAQKFRVEESAGGEQASSWFLDWLRHSRLVDFVGRILSKVFSRSPAATKKVVHTIPNPRPHSLARLVLFILIAALLFGAWVLIGLLRPVALSQWSDIFQAAMLTLARVLAIVVFATLWTVPAGLAIGLNPRIASFMQPIVQVVASFPAPMLFPIVVGFFAWAGISIGWGSMALMLLGTQWYILFNVVAGAMAIPADQRETARSFRYPLSHTLRNVYLPGIFPYLVTGWVTAAGGAWNASIVSEYVTYKSDILIANGLGAKISQAAASGNFPLLAASVVMMSAVVVVFNRTIWNRLYQLAQDKYSLTK